MTTFGETLRSFRQSSNDPDRLNKRLTQERLGKLIGHEMDDLGFSGAAISDWERGESKINAQDRKVLIALIQVLHRCSGLQILAEANQLLEAGNYRALDINETQKIFGEIFIDENAEERTMDWCHSLHLCQRQAASFWPMGHGGHPLCLLCRFPRTLGCLA